MKILLDYTKGLDSYGRISDVALFVRNYNTMPHRLTYSNITPIDFEKLNEQKVRELFPECNSFIWNRVYKLTDVEVDDNEFDEHWNNIAYEMGGRNGESPNHSYENKDFSMYFDRHFIMIGDTFVTLFYDETDNNPEKFLNEVLAKFPRKSIEPSPLTIDVIGFGGGDYYTSEEKINATHTDITKNYNDDFVEVYEVLKNFVQDKERKSGIALLRGLAGSGKTTIVRNLISSVPANYIYITPAIASHLAEPDFMGFLLEHKDSVFILEDCEQVIMAREDTNFSTAVASLLNMSDGLMSDIFNGKFICTFNSNIDSIDQALLRPGRCIVNYEFGKLSLEKTIALFKELYPNDTNIPEKEMTLAELYNIKGVKSNEDIVTTDDKHFGF